MRKRCIKKTGRGLLLSLVICILQGCIGDDVTLCRYDGVHFFFKYDYNVEGTDQLSKEPIKKIGLYVFDEHNLFYGYYVNDEKQINTAGYRFRLDLPTGRYNFVAWAEDNAETYAVSDLVKGSTSINDVRLKIKSTDNVSVKSPGLLMHGQIDAFDTTDSQLETATINLVKNVNDIKINILNLPEKYSLANTKVAVSIRNDEYKFDNTIAETAQLLLYTSTYTPHELGRTAAVRVLKMEKGVESRLKIITTLVGATRADQEVILYENKLIELIGLNPSIDFGRQHDYTVDLDFGNGASLIIAVNDWIVFNSEQEIE